MNDSVGVLQDTPRLLPSGDLVLGGSVFIASGALERLDRDKVEEFVRVELLSIAARIAEMRRDV